MHAMTCHTQARHYVPSTCTPCRVTPPYVRLVGPLVDNDNGGFLTEFIHKLASALGSRSPRGATSGTCVSKVRGSLLQVHDRWLFEGFFLRGESAISHKKPSLKTQYDAIPRPSTRRDQGFMRRLRILCERCCSNMRAWYMV